MELTLSGDSGEVKVPFYTTIDPQEFIMANLALTKEKKHIQISQT